MADRESSVVVSLSELLQMEEQRRRDVDAAERARAAAVERKRLDDEAALRAELEERARSSQAAKRERELRSEVETAQIEAHKAVQIEKSRLEVQVRNYADQLAAREAHARELQAMLDARGGRASTIVAAGLAALATIVAIVAIAFAMRREPAPIVTPAPRDNSGELEQTKKKIAALEQQILDLKIEKPAPPPTSTIGKPPAYKPPPPPPSGGTKCPPGVKGIPMCP
jgi:colicin import membrane protein